MLIPIIKNLCPEIIARDLASVQPMTGDAGSVFSMRVTTEAPPARHGMIRHSFTEGWQRYYHGEWISDALWWKLKIKGLA